MLHSFNVIYNTVVTEDRLPGETKVEVNRSQSVNRQEVNIGQGYWAYVIFRVAGYHDTMHSGGWGPGGEPSRLVHFHFFSGNET